MDDERGGGPKTERVGEGAERVGERTDRSEESRGGHGGVEPEEPRLYARLARTVLPAGIRRSYGAKFAVAFLLVVMLISALGVASYVQTQEITRVDAERTLQSNADLRADSTSDWVASLRAETRGGATTDVYRVAQLSEIRGHLRRSLQRAAPHVVGFHYVDPGTGEIRVSTAAGYEDRRVDDVSSTWWDAIGEVQGSDEWNVSAADAAYERDGETRLAFAASVDGGILVVVGSVPTDYEQRNAARAVLTSDVLTKTGRNVFDPNASVSTTLAATPEFAAATRGERTIREHGDDVVAITPVDANDWIVVTAAPKTELYQASATVGRNVVVLVAASLVTLTGVALVLGYGTISSLRRLRRRAEAMEDGDLDVDLRTHREDEIGRLFLAFDNMRGALKAQIRQAHEARERAEQSRRDLQRQNDRLDQFASTVSHDLRNPLNVASGHLQLIDQKLGDLGREASDAMGSHVEKIDHAHRRMESIIQDVLALARQGQDIEETQSVDLGALARDAWATVDSGPVAFDVVNTRTLEADPDRLRQALENLFRNAVEHGTPDGVETDGDGGVQDDPAAASEPPLTVEVGGTADGFYVADDGSGIPSDAVEDVFEYGHTTNQDGTGFGLAIVETIVDAHGWSIEVDETSRDGAKFVITGVDEQT